MEYLTLEGLDLWRLLAGLGIFLFGMFLLEEGIQALSGQAFQRLLHRFTNRPVKAVLTGALATAVLQSSSAVSLMTLAFVGAGTLALGNAMGVIVGTNLGTTATSWIVASIGFKLEIESLALPFIGMGGLILIFLGKRPKYAAFSRLLTGFGFLFMGLDFMKNAVGRFTSELEPAFFQDIPTWIYFFLGLLLTAITQSSSASIAILLTLIHAGSADLYQGCLFVIGANIGTTITVILGTLGGTVVKKQVAASHVIFNWITGLLALALLPVIIMLLLHIFPNARERVMQIALFHTLFNLIGVILFLPFTSWMGRLVHYIFPSKHHTITKYLHLLPAQVGEAGAEALRNESWHLLSWVIERFNKVLNMKSIPDLQCLSEITLPDDGPMDDEIPAKINDAMLRFAADLQTESLSRKQSDLVNRSLFASRLGLYSIAWINMLHQELNTIKEESHPVHAVKRYLAKQQKELYQLIPDCFSEEMLKPDGYQNFKSGIKHRANEQAALMALIGKENHEMDPLHLTQLMTILKAWDLAWRNLLQAFRELAPGLPHDQTPL